MTVVCRVGGGQYILIPENVKHGEDTDDMADEWEGNPDAELLRAIQRWDERALDPVIDMPGVNFHVMVMGVASALGVRLGLTCTGQYEGGGFWKHNGDTCPVHEWLVPSDSAHYDPSEEWEVSSAKR